MDENKVADVTEIVFATLVNHANKVVFFRLWVGNDIVDFSCDEGCFVVCVVNAKGEARFQARYLSTNSRGFITSIS